MRLAFTLALCAGFTSAFASFELALISDGTQKCIHRYDPTTGSYLGSFGKGSLTSAAGVVADRSTGKAFVLDTASNVIRCFNFNTGEYLYSSVVFSTASSTRLCIDPGRSRIYSTGQGAVNVLDEGLSSVFTAYTEPGANFYGIDLIAGRYLSVSNVAAGRLDSLDLTAAIPSFITGSVYATTSNVTTMASRNDGVLYGIAVQGTAGPIRLQDQNTAYANSKTSSLSSITGLSYGHSDHFYAVGTLASGASTLGRYITDSLFATGGEVDTLALTNVSSPTGMYVVIAPEPSSVIALSLGGLALLRRRKL